MKTRMTSLVRALAVGGLASLALTGCSKSVDHYLSEPSERGLVLAQCFMKQDTSSDCKHAMEAETQASAERQAKAVAESRAREAAEAQEKARLKAEREAAEEKFKPIEADAKAKYDKGEALLNQFSNSEVQSRLTKFASELGRGDATAAAAALGVEPAVVFPFVQDATTTEGFSIAKITSMNLRPGAFRFQLKYPGYSRDQAPTGYDLDAKNSSLDLAVLLVGTKSPPPSIEGSVLCVRFKYQIGVNEQTGQARFSVLERNADRCVRDYVLR
jgi:hypothetical protein